MGGYRFTREPGVPKALNDLARHEMISRLYLDIFVDIQICKLEGWDPLEYIQELDECIGSLRSQIGYTLKDREEYYGTTENDGF